MARKKRSHRRRRRRVGAAPTYAGIGKHRRHKRRRRLGAAPTYAGIGRRRKMHRRRHRIHGPMEGMTGSLKEYGLMLLGGGIAKLGADLFVSKILVPLPAFLNEEIMGAIKVAGGGVVYHLGKSNPLVRGAGIGIGVSGLTEIVDGLIPGWWPQSPFGPGHVHGPDKTLFVQLEKPALAAGENDFEEAVMADDSPIVAGDSPIIGY